MFFLSLSLVCVYKDQRACVPRTVIMDLDILETQSCRIKGLGGAGMPGEPFAGGKKGRMYVNPACRLLLKLLIEETQEQTAGVVIDGPQRDQDGMGSRLLQGSLETINPIVGQPSLPCLAGIEYDKFCLA